MTKATRRSPSVSSTSTTEVTSTRCVVVGIVAPSRLKGVAWRFAGAAAALVQFALAFLAAILCLRLCAGCALVEKAGAKEKVVLALKTAYAEGGAVAVSNRIERLVGDGTLSRKQADRLHVIAQTAYDRVLDRLENEIATGVPE